MRAGGGRPAARIGRKTLRLSVCTLFLFFAAGVSAQEEFSLPENYEARQELWEKIVSPRFVDLAREKPLVLGQELARHRVRFSVERQTDPSGGQAYLYLLFLNEDNESGGFPINGPGAFIIKRDLVTGDFLQAKIFLRSGEAASSLDGEDHGSYLRIRPDVSQPRTMTTLEFVLFGHRMNSHVSLPFSMEQILKLPASALVRSGLTTADWDLIFPRPEPQVRPLLEMLKEIRRVLHDLVPIENAVMDERGIFVHRLTGTPLPEAGFSSLGLAKWIADGVYRGVKNRGISLAALLEKPLTLRGTSLSQPWEEAADPFQALDWVRNLAWEVRKALYPERRNGLLDADVKGLEGVQALPHRGFALSELRLVLYLLAVRQPGKVYLGSVSQDRRPARGAPLLAMHDRAVAFFPWIGEKGAFHLAIFDTVGEVSWERFASSAPDGPEAMVHLVELPVMDGFNLPPLARRAEIH